jgi:hypothetical protein
MPSQGGEEERFCLHWSCRLGSLGAKSVILPRRPGRDIMIMGEGRMMCGSGGGNMGGRGVGGDNSYNTQINTSIDDSGCHRPMAAVRPHSTLLSTQQSTKSRESVCIQSVLALGPLPGSERARHAGQRDPLKGGDHAR